MAPKNKKKEVSHKAAPEVVTKDTPNWPLFSPLINPLDLSLEDICPGQIVCIRNFWTSSLCKNYVAFLNTLPLVTTPGKPKKGDAVRVNDRYQCDDPAFAGQLWASTALQRIITTEEGSGLSDVERNHLWGGATPYFPYLFNTLGGDCDSYSFVHNELSQRRIPFRQSDNSVLFRDVIGLNPNIRIYRYKKGQFFDQHYDDTNAVEVLGDGGAPIQARTTWTLLLYLTSPATGCVGGETVFYPDPSTKKGPVPDPVVVELEVGMALLHKHGNDCMLHEGREVKDGEKWIIRSDLCVRR